ncbi:MAG TPA: endonuclease/exonuclease/phosphatase family protein [Candidatus Saccharimonadales bacterium]|nr:endonuclease/exonuclease/phosphatase family protein [Candidatus Saccharimonadales bacterium]
MSHPAEISLLQWNTWYDEDPENVARFLCEQKPDIICAQELTVGRSQTVPHMPEYIAARLGYNAHYQELPIESTDGKQLMLANAIFSRFPIKNGRFVWVSEPAETGGYGDEYRAYVEAALEIGDRELIVGTAHLSYTHKFEPTPAKQKETEHLLTELKKHQENYVFAGDLNAPPGSPTIRAIGKLLQNAGPGVSQNTWTTKPFSYNGFSESGLNWRLDYVFHTPDLQVAAAEILPTEFSDHLPILVRIHL